MSTATAAFTAHAVFAPPPLRERIVRTIVYPDPNVRPLKFILNGPATDLNDPTCRTFLAHRNANIKALKRAALHTLRTSARSQAKREIHKANALYKQLTQFLLINAFPTDRDVATDDDLP